MYKITITYNNILNSNTQALVNPAKTSLLAGSGLCGVIHKYAGSVVAKYNHLNTVN